MPTKTRSAVLECGSWASRFLGGTVVKAAETGTYRLRTHSILAQCPPCRTQCLGALRVGEERGQGVGETVVISDRN